MARKTFGFVGNIFLEFGATYSWIFRRYPICSSSRSHEHLTCTEPDGTFHYRSAALGNSNGGSAIHVWRVGDDSPGDPGFTNVDNFEPGARYFFTLDGGTQTTPSGGQCGPVHLDTHGITANLWLHIPNGPSTHQILALSNGREIGSQII